jgi:hypothetical protein
VDLEWNCDARWSRPVPGPARVPRESCTVERLEHRERRDSKSLHPLRLIRSPFEHLVDHQCCPARFPDPGSERRGTGK